MRHLNSKSPQPRKAALPCVGGDNSDNETGFRMYRWDGVNVVWNLIGTVGANVTTFTDSGRPCGNGDTYEVKPSMMRASQPVRAGSAARSNACSTCYTLSRTHTGSGADHQPDQLNWLPDRSVPRRASVNLTSTPMNGWHVGSWAAQTMAASTTNSLTMPASSHTVGVNYVANGLANDDFDTPTIITSLPFAATPSLRRPQQGQTRSCSTGCLNGPQRVLQKRLVPLCGRKWR